jgi:hypothetical protein
MLPGSNIKRLQSMIPKLLEVSDSIVTKSSIYNTLNNSVNGKRHATEDAAEGLGDEIQNGPKAYKKIHSIDSDEDEVIILDSTSGETLVNKIEEKKSPKIKAFSIEYLVDPEAEKFFNKQNKNRTVYWHGTSPIAEMTLRREDFQMLPESMAVRLSKDHAKLTATKLDKGIQYEISDLSVNGIYYLGNRIDGDYIKGKAWRIKKHVTYRLKNRDIIGVLMKKETGNKDMLIGFEFVIEDGN